MITTLKGIKDILAFITDEFNENKSEKSENRINDYYEVEYHLRDLVNTYEGITKMTSEPISIKVPKKLVKMIDDYYFMVFE